jgi:hypothetical protein
MEGEAEDRVVAGSNPALGTLFFFENFRVFYVVGVSGFCFKFWCAVR